MNNIKMKQTNTRKKIRRALTSTAVAGASLAFVAGAAFIGLEKMRNFEDEGRNTANSIDTESGNGICELGEYSVNVLPMQGDTFGCEMIFVGKGENRRLVQTGSNEGDYFPPAYADGID